MQTVGVTSSVHETAGEFIYDYDLAVLHYIVYVPLHHGVSLKGVQHVMVVFHALRISEVLQAEILLGLGHAGFSQHDLLILLVHGVVLFHAKFLDELVGSGIEIRGVFPSS